MSTNEPVLTRDNWQCFRCGAAVWHQPYSIHHRILGNRKDNRMSNLVTLCGSGTTGCHGAVHGLRTPGNTDYSRVQAMDDGYIVSKFSQAPPSAVPIYHHRFGFVFLDDDGGITAKAAS